MYVLPTPAFSPNCGAVLGIDAVLSLPLTVCLLATTFIAFTTWDPPSIAF